MYWNVGGGWFKCLIEHLKTVRSTSNLFYYLHIDTLYRTALKSLISSGIPRVKKAKTFKKLKKNARFCTFGGRYLENGHSNRVAVCFIVSARKNSTHIESQIFCVLFFFFFFNRYKMYKTCGEGCLVFIYVILRHFMTSSDVTVTIYVTFATHLAGFQLDRCFLSGLVKG